LDLDNARLFLTNEEAESELGWRLYQPPFSFKVERLANWIRYTAAGEPITQQSYGQGSFRISLIHRKAQTPEVYPTSSPNIQLGSTNVVLVENGPSFRAYFEPPANDGVRLTAIAVANDRGVLLDFLETLSNPDLRP
jgi:hypothetical protein